MPKLDDNLKEILGDGADLVKTDFKKLIKSTKSDSCSFIKNQGKDLERYVAALAQEGITKNEFENLVKGLVSLNKVEYYFLTAKVKVRAREIANKISELTLEGMLKMI